MKKAAKNLTIAFTYIGTIIGAGFASGQEIKVFFVDFKGAGFFALMLASFLFFYIGREIMLLGYIKKADSYEVIFKDIFTYKTYKFLDFTIILLLMGSFTTMLSGMGAFLKQNFNINYAFGSFSFMIICVITVILGIKGILKMNTSIVPVLLITTGVVAISSIYKVNISESFISEDVRYELKGILSGVLYASYNLIMAISILPVLGGIAESKKEINKAAIIGGSIIGVFGLIIYFSLYLNYDKIQAVEIPLLTIASCRRGVVYLLYGVSFSLAVFTTAISALYGIYSRLHKSFYFLGIILITYAFSLIGFSKLIEYLYSIMGYIGAIIILMLLRGNRKEIKKLKDGDI